MYKLISTGLGIGYIPKGGGTVASVACCLCIYFFRPGGDYYDISISAVVTVILIAVGILTSYKVESEWGKDNYRVVIDEIAGMWISLLFIPVKLSYIIAGLILFRVFDIGKPFFIRKMENLPGGIGVMADDVLAGIYSNILLQIAVAYNLL